MPPHKSKWNEVWSTLHRPTEREIPTPGSENGQRSLALSRTRDCENCRRHDMSCQLGTKNSKSNEDREEKNVGVKGRDGSAEELDGETGEEQWGGHVERMAVDRLPKRAAELRAEGGQG